MTISQFPLAALGGTAGLSRVAIFTASGTFVHPDASAGNPKPIRVFAVGGGGGGGSGGRHTVNQGALGGAGGGSGFAMAWDWFVENPAIVTVGAGGTAPAGRNTRLDGLGGGDGGTSSFNQLAVRGGYGGTLGTSVSGQDARNTGGWGGSAGGYSAMFTGFSGQTTKVTGGGSFGSHHPYAGLSSTAQLTIVARDSAAYSGGNLFRIQEAEIALGQGSEWRTSTRSTQDFMMHHAYNPNRNAGLARYASGGGGAGGLVFFSNVSANNTGGDGGFGYLGNGGKGGNATAMNTTTGSVGATVLAGGAGTGYGGGGGGGGALTNVENNTATFSGNGGAGAPGVVLVYY